MYIMTYCEVACGIMFNKRGKILMGLRSSKGPYPGIWEFPGGQLEKEETIEECLQREWMEELNLKITIEKEIYVSTYDKYLCRFFVGKIIDEENMKQHVHDDIIMIDKENIVTLKLFDGDEKVLEFV